MFITRVQLGEDEARRLAPDGLKSRESRGREFSEDEHLYSARVES